MKKRIIPSPQYHFETKNLEQDNEYFLSQISPLIGRIVINFNSLEQYITEFIIEEISDRAHDKGSIFTNKLTCSSKIDLILRYVNWYHSIGGKKIEKFNQLIDNLKEASRLRNLVVHAEWDTSHLDGYTFTRIIVNKKGIQQEYVQFSVDSISEINEYINETIEEFLSFQEIFSNLKTK